jgi:serine/threonine protein kinase
MGAGSESPGDSPFPQQFGDYSVLGHLATGGMAEVFVARKTGMHGFEKIVVIKRVRPDLTEDASTTRRFLDEARLVATLEHPNIVQVHEVGYAHGSYFFVMDYIDGVDLRQLMWKSAKFKRKITLADAIYIMTHVCAGLHYAHEKRDHNGKPLGIIHRDVSPSNVLISHNGAVKVCDFGIAKAHGQTTDTSRGTLKGKFSYMSPEQCRCETLDQRSDVFAIGVILFELTTASRLFHTKSDFDTLRAIVDGPIPTPSSRVPDYPSELETIVMRALQKEPRKRYPTAQGLQLELEAFAREYKLAMSSVNIAKLVSSLFDKSDVVARAREAADKSDTLVRPSEKPGAFARGSEETNTDRVTDPDPVPPARKPSAPPVVVARPSKRVTRPPAPRGASPLWIVAALLCGLAAGGALLAQSLIKPAGQEVKRDLDMAAEKIVSALETSLRTARARAESMATSPMVRAAIHTDGATLRDLAEDEAVFRVGKRETIEVFQARDGQSVSALRLPSHAVALPALDADESRLVAREHELRLVTSAPIAAKGIAGMIELEVPIDLASAKRAFAEHATWVILTGAGEITIVPGTPASEAEQMKISVAVPDELAATPLIVVAAAKPRPTAELGWLGPVRYAGFAGAGLFLLIYVAAAIAARRARAS